MSLSAQSILSRAISWGTDENMYSKTQPLRVRNDDEFCVFGGLKEWTIELFVQTNMRQLEEDISFLGLIWNVI